MVLEGLKVVAVVQWTQGTLEVARYIYDSSDGGYGLVGPHYMIGDVFGLGKSQLTTGAFEGPFLSRRSPFPVSSVNLLTRLVPSTCSTVVWFRLAVNLTCT